MLAGTAALLRSPLPLGGGDAETGRLPLPPRLLVAPWGESTDLAGAPVIVNAKTVEVLSSNQARLGRAEVALDFEHNSLKPAREPVPVAAYGSLEVVEGEGIYLVLAADSWTPEGRDAYSGRHYRDLSPTVYRDESGAVIGLHSVALTRAGQLPELRAYSALSSDLKTLASETTAPATMDNPDYRALLCKRLGLDPECTDEELVAAAEAEAKPEPAAMAAKPEDKPEDKPEPLSADARLDRIERRQLIAEAKAEGKLIPLNQAALDELPLSALSTLLDGLEPGQVPTSGTTPTAGAQPGPVALSAEERTVCKTLGISEEDFRKSNPAA